MSQDWLMNSLLKGLQGLLLLRLDGCPSADTVQSLANAWRAVLSNIPHTWDETRDKPRIQRAFLTLAADCKRWPAPRHFIEALPPIAPQLKLAPPVDRNIPPQVRNFIDEFLKKAKA